MRRYEMLINVKYHTKTRMKKTQENIKMFSRTEHAWNKS